MKKKLMLVCCALSVVSLSGCSTGWWHDSDDGQDGIPHAAPGGDGSQYGISGGPAGQ